MASLQQRKGFWYVVYYNAEGKQKWVKGYTDKRETQALANRLEDEKTKIQRGELDPKVEQRKVERAKGIAAHVEEYKAALQAKGNNPNHVAYTIADINKFIDFAEVTHADAVTRAMVDRWVLSLIEAKTDSRRTINRRVGSLQAFLKHLNTVGTLSEYVLLKYPKLKTHGHETRKRRALELAEQKKLMGKTTPAERAEIYKFVLLGTAARHIQCANLTVADLNFAQKTITLHTKDSAHRNRVHVVPMHKSLVPILKKRTKDQARDALVFPDLPSKDDAAEILRSDCKAAGIDTTDIDFHALRHTAITTLAHANVHPNVLQAIAGHADIETTLGYYTHFKRADERAAIDGLKV